MFDEKFMTIQEKPLENIVTFNLHCVNSTPEGKAFNYYLSRMSFYEGGMYDAMIKLFEKLIDEIKEEKDKCKKNL